MKKFGLLATSALGSFALVGLAGTAHAQTGQSTSTQADPPEALSSTVELQSGQASDQIVVTGSRIRRPNLDSTVPITSVGVQELTDRGEVSLGDALNELPALRATWSQANSTTSIGTAGLSMLDLRGLGTARTLVLVNGRRHVTAQPGNYNVDVNTIPVDLLERVDVITGGNSAVYGSDAVAGVVNFILRRDFEGIKIRGQGGISTYGDRGNYFVSGIVGRNFFDGRLNIALHGEYSLSNPVFDADRPYRGAYTGIPGWVTSQITTAPNRNFDGIPNTNFVYGNPGINFGNISLGGYVTGTCPVAGARPPEVRGFLCTGQNNPQGDGIAYNFAFMPDGTLVRDIPVGDLRNIGGGVLGGLSATGIEDAMLLPGLERITGNLLISGDFSSAFQPFLEAKFVRVNAEQQSTQPTFLQSTLPNSFSINNPFLTEQARQQLLQLVPGRTTFTMLRFNNDFGTRSEQHRRDTYRIVAGVGGDLSTTGNLRYEAAFNYGRTETYYETGGNVHLQRFRNAYNAVRNDAGQIVCAINADANPANDDAACVPINLFGYGAPSQEALNYILHTSTRNEEAEQINATAFLSGDTSGIFELPGGAIGAAIGVEYRRESAYSEYDPVTRSGATFLNAFQIFDPPSVEIKEAFGELRIPILANLPFIEELTLEGAARVSDYGGSTGAVWAYNFGGIYSPMRGLRVRAGYARSVRAPNLSNLFASAAETFLNALTDPCNQEGAGGIADNPNRAANCAAAGIPTTITYVTDAGETVTRPWNNTAGSGISGINSGNPDLIPEVGKSLTVGAVFEPTFVPGFTFSVDYYDIEVENVISGLSGQQILNRCYDDPTGIDNEFCSAIFRRRSDNPIQDFTFDGQTSRRLSGVGTDFTFGRSGAGISFINQPYNFAALKVRGIDFEAAYRTRLSDSATLNLRGIVSHLIQRENFSYLTQPERSDRLHGVLGYPRWAANFNANIDFGQADITYRASFIARQTLMSWETQFTHQGRGPTNPDARPFTHYPDVVYHNLRFGFQANENFRFYTGVDNVLNQLPPYELSGKEDGAPYSNVGRYFYAGAEIRF